MDYYFELAGLHVLLQTPYTITISENLRPFLSEAYSTVDFTITLEICDRLPACSEQGMWHGLEYYEHNRVFHFDSPKQSPFAVTEFLENGNITVSVLQDMRSYFTGSIGIFNRIGLETLLLQHQGLLLHASLIKYKNKTIALAGPSGVGKSTQAALWEKALGAAVLNGDRAALRKVETGWAGYGYPCAGTSGIYKKDSAPLAAVVVLGQAEENHLRQLSPAEALRLLYPEISIHRWDKDFATRATDLFLDLTATVPVYFLACRPDEDAVLLVKKGLML